MIVIAVIVKMIWNSSI